MEEAITRFVSDAMNALESGWSIDQDRDGKVQDAVEDPTARTMETSSAGRGGRDTAARSANGGAGAGGGRTAARSPGEGGRPAAAMSADDGGEGAMSAGEVGGASAMSADDGGARVSPDEDGAAMDRGSGGDWQDPAPAWREPTLILPGGGQSSSAKEVARPASGRLGAPVEQVDMDATAPQGGSPWDGEIDDSSIDASTPDLRPGRRVVDPISARLEGRSGEGPIGELDEMADDELDRGGESGAGTEDGLELEADAGVTPVGDERPTSPLARELRRKMSMMAERLFPGRGGDRSRLDVGLAHHAHADIDLTAIGVDTARGAGGTAPYEAMGSVDTFADTNPLSRLEQTPPGGMPADEREETTGRRRSISREPPARGELGDIDVATLMGRLLQSRFTGRVQFRRGPAEKAIQFEDGRPVFAVSNLPHDRMGDLLYREGKITREQQQRARDLVVESGRRMGEILVEIGFLKPRELLPAVRHHIEDIVYSLFAWDSGEFAIAAGEPTSERIRLTRHPAAIVLEGVRRKYGPEMLEVRLGSPTAVVAVRSQRQLGAIAAVADLSPSERAVIQKLDGERTMQQVGDAAQADQVVALQLAFGLIALGVAEVVDHGTAAAERPPVRSRSLVGETDIAIDRQRVLAKHALVHEADYFTLLGVRRDATSFEIRRAYEAARRDYASGGFPAELQRELAGELGEINRLIDEAYQVLRDEQVRRSYQSNLLD
jgi:hypothetical protein